MKGTKNKPGYVEVKYRAPGFWPIAISLSNQNLFSYEHSDLEYLRFKNWFPQASCAMAIEALIAGEIVSGIVWFNAYQMPSVWPLEWEVPQFPNLTCTNQKLHLDQALSDDIPDLYSWAKVQLPKVPNSNSAACRWILLWLHLLFAPLAVGGEATAQGGPRMPQRGAPHRGRLGERPTAVRGWRQVCGPCHPRWCHWLVRSGRMAPRQGLGVLPGQAPWFGEAFFFARDWGSPMFPSHCGVPLGSPLAPGWARWSKSSVARWRIWRRSPRGPKLWPPATRATERAMWSTWTTMRTTPCAERGCWPRWSLGFVDSYVLLFPESVWAQGSSNSGGLYLIFSSSHLLIFTSSHLHIFSSSHLLIFTSAHLHICSSSHLHIFTSSHLLIFTSSHLHICSSSHLLIFASSHLRIFSSSHLLIFTSAHLHIFSSSHFLIIFTYSHPHIFTSSHLRIFSSSHLLIFTSSHLHIFTAHLHIFTSAHLRICSSSHLLILTSSHLHILTSSHLLLLPSCPLLLFYFSSEGGGRGSANETARNATLSHETRFDRQKLR